MKLFWLFSILLSFSIELSANARSENYSFNPKKIEFKFGSLKKDDSLQVNYTFSIKGMTRSKCVKKVSSAIKSIKGVKSVKVDLKKERAIVVFTDTVNVKETAEKIEKALEKIGYSAKIK